MSSTPQLFVFADLNINTPFNFACHWLWQSWEDWTSNRYYLWMNWKRCCKRDQNQLCQFNRCNCINSVGENNDRNYLLKLWSLVQ